MRPRSSFLVLAAVVAAFALGSAGTAVAGPTITKKVVRKIAAKVVKTAAPTLAVASAGQAGNADKLDGLDSSDLKTTTYSFTLTPTADGPNQYQGFPGVPAGTYLATYDALLSTAASVDCVFIPSTLNSSVVVARAYSSSSGAGASTASGAAALAVGTKTAFRCASGTNFHIVSGEVTLTRIDTLTQGAAQQLI